MVERPIHERLVRITHWINAAVFVALTLSGIAILTAHPRFYWGETGFFDTPAAFELPFDAILDPLYIRAQGRNVHFLTAWLAVINGLAYVLWGIWTGHFSARFAPNRKQLEWTSIKAVIRRHLRLQNPYEESGYNVLQKLAYTSVVFGLMPLVILSGLTMSPAVTAAFPQLFTLFGGRQSARTFHFLLANVLVVFVLMHVFMVWLAGFRKGIRSMLGGEQ